uniref:Uncharacterized protein n=1 Tax=Lepeophtheirus salmonis TaxID=72036 RepID=A0A0K2VFU7_LEPSM
MRTLTATHWVSQSNILSFYRTPQFLYGKVFDDSVEDLKEFMYRDNY